MTQDALDKQPPSSKLVYKVLEENGSLTQKELAEESFLPQRTVRDAVTRLEDANVLKERVCIHNAKKSRYSLQNKQETSA